MCTDPFQGFEKGASNYVFILCTKEIPQNCFLFRPEKSGSVSVIQLWIYIEVKGQMMYQYAMWTKALVVAAEEVLEESSDALHGNISMPKPKHLHLTSCASINAMSGDLVL